MTFIYVLLLQQKLTYILFYQICDKAGDPCHNLCGGAGCDRCGGLSCEEGAVGKADAGLSLTEGNKQKISDHLKNAEMLYRQV